MNRNDLWVAVCLNATLWEKEKPRFANVIYIGFVFVLYVLCLLYLYLNLNYSNSFIIAKVGLNACPATMVTQRSINKNTHITPDGEYFPLDSVWQYMLYYTALLNCIILLHCTAYLKETKRKQKAMITPTNVLLV